MDRTHRIAAAILWCTIVVLLAIALPITNKPLAAGSLQMLAGDSSLAAQSAPAGTIYVDGCAPGPGEYGTLTAAVEAASSGDTIVMQSGSYPEEDSVSFSENLEIHKALTLTAANGPAVVGGYYVGWKDVEVPITSWPAEVPYDPLPFANARVYYPSTAPGGTQTACGGPFPAVVYAHGRRGTEDPCKGWSNPDPSQDYLQARGILTRLAASGIIAISVDHHWAHTYLAAKVSVINNTIAYLRDEEWLEGVVDLKNVGLSGHSTGGAAAINAASSSPVPITALGLLAPGCPNPLWGRPSEPCQMASPPVTNTLVLHGTNEYRCQVGNGPVAIYCDTNTTKHLVVVGGANHFGYTDGICIADDNDSKVGGVDGQEARARQQRTARNYVHAFFANSLKGDVGAIEYFIQDTGQGQQCPVDPQFGDRCEDPVVPPSCDGRPQRFFDDLEELSVEVKVCSLP